jgi:hypothetical protein
MRKHSLLLIFLTMLWSTSHAGWFGNDEQQRQQEINRLNGQLDQEQRSNGNMQGIIITLGVGCVVMLVTGAAIGSKARKAANERRK